MAEVGHYGILTDGQVKDEVKRIEARRELEHITDLHKLLGEPWGRRLAYWVIYELCGLEDASYNPGTKYNPDRETNYNEGRRAVGRDFRGELRGASVDKYMRMLTDEATARDEWFKNKAAAIARAKEKEADER